MKSSVEQRLGFIEQGAMRAFLDVDGKAVNHDLYVEGDFVCELDSFISRKPTDATIIADTETKLVTISYRDIKTFYDISEEGESLVRVIFETIHNKKREQEIVLRIAAAADKLNFFIKNHPEHYKSFKRKEIASYLNIAPETFSRLYPS